MRLTQTENLETKFILQRSREERNRRGRAAIHVSRGTKRANELEKRSTEEGAREAGCSQKTAQAKGEEADKLRNDASKAAVKAKKGGKKKIRETAKEEGRGKIFVRSKKQMRNIVAYTALNEERSKEEAHRGDHEGSGQIR